jgi:hypothetical protein
MAVQAYDKDFGKDGYAENMMQFRQSHEQNTAGLLNVSEGKKVGAPRAPYDPNHPDNQWPVMVHHPVKGELTVGENLLGMPNMTERDKKARQFRIQENEKALSAALGSGYRREPYAKPIIAMMDPVTEKANLAKDLAEKDGLIKAQNDQLAKLSARLELLEAAKK